MARFKENMAVSTLFSYARRGSGNHHGNICNSWENHGKSIHGKSMENRMKQPWKNHGKLNGKSMGNPWIIKMEKRKCFRGTPWVTMGAHGDPWAPMRNHGFPWVPMGSHGFPWVPMGPPWVPMGPVLWLQVHRCSSEPEGVPPPHGGRGSDPGRNGRAMQR